MLKKLNLKEIISALVLLSFVTHPIMSHAQFSNSWDLAKAIKDLDYSEMRSAITKGANINVRNGDGFPGIVLAADMQNIRLMRFLLENGANPDVGILASDETAMMRRADVGDMESIRLLVEFGADVNYANRTGETALMRAIRSRKRRTIAGLIEIGADLEMADYTGRTALDYAEETRSARIIKLVRDGLGQ